MKSISRWSLVCATFPNRSSLFKKLYTPVALFSDLVNDVLAMWDFLAISDWSPNEHPWSLRWQVASQVVRPMSILRLSYIDNARYIHVGRLFRKDVG